MSQNWFSRNITHEYAHFVWPSLTELIKEKLLWKIESEQFFLIIEYFECLNHCISASPSNLFPFLSEEQSSRTFKMKLSELWVNVDLKWIYLLSSVFNSSCPLTPMAAAKPRVPCGWWRSSGVATGDRPPWLHSGIEKV